MEQQRKEIPLGDGAAAASRPRVLYISYDGAAEPLGRSQVLPYLERLAADYEITLLSFEKPDDDAARVTELLEAAGIRWLRRRYHRSPPVLSTLYDVLTGVRAVRREQARNALQVIHVRSYVPALIALWAGKRGARLLFDIRGFWADERVEGHLWKPGGVLYRIAKRCERRFFAEADAVVTLTRASLPQLRRWLAGRDVPLQVIPTCTDTGRYGRDRPREQGPHTVWCGSIGTWYRFDLAVRMARELGLPFTVLTRQTGAAREHLGGMPAEVRTATPDDVPDELRPGDIGLCLIQPSFSKTSSAPTRFAEYLAAGMPVVTLPGVGDLEELVQERGLGVVLREESDAAVRSAAERLRELSADDEVRERCRQTARDLFDLSAGVSKYAELYRGLAPTRELS